MTQQIGITIDQQKLNVPLPALLSLLAQEQAVPTAAGFSLPAEFGKPLQGGIYVGPIIEDGKVVHLIAANETLDPLDWDGANTAGSEYRDGLFDDWYLPTKAELLIALIYAQSAFEHGYHWSSTPYESYVWAVDFEYGVVGSRYRSTKFRVRPFRRFIA